LVQVEGAETYDLAVKGLLPEPGLQGGEDLSVDLVLELEEWALVGQHFHDGSDQTVRCLDVLCSKRLLYPVFPGPMQIQAQLQGADLRQIRKVAGRGNRQPRRRIVVEWWFVFRQRVKGNV
jgi:hypothetical protein